MKEYIKFYLKKKIFNIFQYLQMKGISMEVQKEYLDEFSEAGEKLEKFMIENPEKVKGY